MIDCVVDVLKQVGSSAVSCGICRIRLNTYDISFRVKALVIFSFIRGIITIS